jgi:hypothetical protein
MDTYEAWKDGRPTFNRLPGINGGYTGNPIADWLTDYPDQIFAGLLYMADVVSPRQVNPLLCDETWLDLLASLCGWHGEYWDRAWPVNSKRILLANSYTVIWPNYGSSSTLSFVLNALGIRHVIQQGQSFIIDRNEVGDPLGAIAWEYDIVLPSNYFNADQYFQTVRINQLFGVIWCKSRIIFDDGFFSPTGLFATADDSLLAVDNLQTILEL